MMRVLNRDLCISGMHVVSKPAVSVNLFPGIKTRGGGGGDTPGVL